MIVSALYLGISSPKTQETLNSSLHFWYFIVKNLNLKCSILGTLDSNSPYHKRLIKGSSSKEIDLEGPKLSSLG